MRIIKAGLFFSVSLWNLAVTSGFTSLSPRTRPSNSLSQIHLAFPDVLVSQETIEASKTLFHAYETSLSQYPITTKAITSGVLATAGDAIAQASSKSDEKYDYERGLCFLLFGAAYTGIFQHYWFDFLSTHVTQWGEVLKVWGPSRVSIPVDDVYSLQEWWSYFDVVSAMEDPPSTTSIATAKLAVNQLFVIPSVYMPLFFAITGSLAKLDLEESIERAQNMYIPLLKRNYFYWLPMQFVQFLLIPAEWQILFISVASLVWTVILSSIATTDQEQQQPQPLTAPQPGKKLTVTANPADAIDAVSLEDVEKALIPQAARKLLDDPKFGSSAAGGVVGLLASAANDGLLGGFVSNLLGATIGSGVAVVAATGAMIGLVTATQKEKEELPLPEAQMALQQPRRGGAPLPPKLAPTSNPQSTVDSIKATR